ncbi:MAG: hypothetical protein ABSH50_09030 [Bryobacteraceae bacterium]|jgi:uncharacterized protein (TIGR03437 family)
MEERKRIPSLCVFLRVSCGFAVILTVAARLPGQTCDSACETFISTTTSAINTFESSLGPATQPIVLSGNLVYAGGALIDGMPLSVMLQYVEGLKAAGAQRVDLNPGVTSINDPTAAAAYDAIVAHIRELGMQLAMNPALTEKDFPGGASFSEFQTTAMSTYPAMAARWQPDNFVIVHEPTTQNARLGVTATTEDWGGFIQAVAPLIRTASPHIRLGAGGFYDSAENTYFEYNVTLPQLDFMTMDVYDDVSFPGLETWVSLAHLNGKGIYMEETWAPKDLPATLPPGWQSNPEGAEAYALVGDCDAAFATMDAAWLQAMALFVSSNQMEAVTPFTTADYFYLGSVNADSPFNDTYISDALQAIQMGQLTATGQAFAKINQTYGVKQVVSLSSASYATISSVFTPDCGSATSPCDAQTVVAPDDLVSAFGADLATTAVLDGTFPTTLGGTTATLVDSSNTSYPVPMFFAAPTQVNYYVPSTVQPGPATLTIKSGDGTQTSGTVLVASVMPGIYTATANGQGAAAAEAIIVHADGSQSTQATFTCSSAVNCSPAPITLASTDALYIELYGTGIRHVSALANATATVAGQSVAVQYAGPSSYTGEDQVNIQIPQSLFNSGTVNLVLTVDGQSANTVQLNLQ